MTPAIMESLYDLCGDHGIEAFVEATKYSPRELIVTLTMTHPDPAQAHVIRLQAFNRWDDEDDWFDEWAKPSFAKMPESDDRTDVTNERLRHCRTSEAVLGEFLDFIGNAEVIQVLKHTDSNSLKRLKNIDL